MKASELRYLLSTLASSALLGASVSPLLALATLTQWRTGVYAVGVDVGWALRRYGTLASCTIRALLWMRSPAPSRFRMDSTEFAICKLITMIHHLGQAALKPLMPIFLMPLVTMMHAAHAWKRRDIARVL